MTIRFVSYNFTFLSIRGVLLYFLYLSCNKAIFCYQIQCCLLFCCIRVSVIKGSFVLLESIFLPSTVAHFVYFEKKIAKGWIFAVIHL